MRALCGAIITAGALICLGLICLGIGMRYENFPYHDADGKVQFVYFRHLDTALMAGFVIAVIVLGIGLAVAFLGLAYHHHRRHLEITKAHGTPGATPPATTTTTERVVT
jgi:hypothetical protein